MLWGSLIILIGLAIAHFGQLWLSLGLFFSLPLVWFNSKKERPQLLVDLLLLSILFFALLLLLAWLSYFPIESKLLQSTGLGLSGLCYYFVAAYRLKTIALKPTNMLLVFLSTALAYYLSFYLSNAIFDSQTVPLRSAKREAIQMVLILLSTNFSISLAIKEDSHA